MNLRVGLVLAAMLFGLLATANSGGYRYGVSDQAFYATAVVKDLHPSFFLRDTPLLDTEARLMWSDEIVAGLARVFGVTLPPLYLTIYALTLIGTFAAAVTFARAAGLSWWAVAALLILLTFRHRIAKTGANSLEGYMHPRELAFALGMMALAGVLAGRYVRAVGWTMVAACWHPTTAFWFALVIGVSLIVARPASRRWITLGAAAAIIAGIWAVLRGPLAGHLVVMDPAWRRVLADKDYLFPLEWPLYAWLANLAYPVVIALIYRARSVRGATVNGERYLVAGLFALVAVFLVSLPFTAIHLALAVQMQVTRVFWLLDFVTAVYVAWWLIDRLSPAPRRARLVIICVLAGISIGRGAYLLSQDRQLVAMTLPRTPWVEAMDWLKAQPSSWYVLADPGHAWKYGVSARLAAEKDTFVESGKDTALAMYDRQIAMTVADRLEAVRDFDHLTTADMHALRARYGLDVVVVEAQRSLDLPVLYRNRQFVIYQLQ